MLTFREFYGICEGKKPNAHPYAVPGTYQEKDGVKTYTLKRDDAPKREPIKSAKKITKMLDKQGGIGGKAIKKAEKKVKVSEDLETRRQQLRQRQLDRIQANKDKVSEYKQSSAEKREAQKEIVRQGMERMREKQAEAKRKREEERQKREARRQERESRQQELQSEQHSTMQPNEYNKQVARQSAAQERESLKKEIKKELRAEQLYRGNIMPSTQKDTEKHTASISGYAKNVNLQMRRKSASELKSHRANMQSLMSKKTGTIRDLHGG
jgi:hypothetical protein